MWPGLIVPPTLVTFPTVPLPPMTPSLSWTAPTVLSTRTVEPAAIVVPV